MVPGWGPWSRLNIFSEKLRLYFLKALHSQGHITFKKLCSSKFWKMFSVREILIVPILKNQSFRLRGWVQTVFLDQKQF